MSKSSQASATPQTRNGSGRLDLAEHVANSRNPLTARVFANRIWHWVFAAGLVTTPDDFGHLGDRPSHPELLDYLADWFIENGWSTKKLVRLLVTSQTFQQSNAVSARGRDADPNNRLLHYYRPRRLDAESIRDSLLAVSGRLDQHIFGRPINPYRSNEDPQKRLFSGPLDGDGRRSVYVKMTIMEPAEVSRHLQSTQPQDSHRRARRHKCSRPSSRPVERSLRCAAGRDLGAGA